MPLDRVELTHRDLFLLAGVCYNTGVNREALNYLLDRRLEAMATSKNSIPREVPLLGLGLWLAYGLFVALLGKPHDVSAWLFYGVVLGLGWGVMVVARCTQVVADLLRGGVYEELKSVGLSAAGLADGLALYLSRRLLAGGLLIIGLLTLFACHNQAEEALLFLVPAVLLTPALVSYLLQAHACWSSPKSSGLVGGLLMLVAFGTPLAVPLLVAGSSAAFFLACGVFLVMPRWLAIFSYEYHDKLPASCRPERGPSPALKSLWSCNPVVARHLVAGATRRPVTVFLALVTFTGTALFSGSLVVLSSEMGDPISSTFLYLFLAISAALTGGMLSAHLAAVAIQCEGQEGLELLRGTNLSRSVMVDGWTLVGAARTFFFLLVLLPGLMSVGLSSSLSPITVFGWLLVTVVSLWTGAYLGAVAALSNTEHFSQKLIGAGLALGMTALFMAPLMIWLLTPAVSATLTLVACFIAIGLSRKISLKVLA